MPGDVESLAMGSRGSPTIDEVLQGRRSVRLYARQDVPDALLSEILDLARHAPSSMDGQPWCFVTIRNPDTLRRIAEAKNAHCPSDKREIYPADFLVSAPVVVAVCVERNRAPGRERENGMVAATQLLLAAQGRGLGGVLLCAYQPHDTRLEHEIRDLLQLPPEIEPVALVPLGFPAHTPTPKTLRPLAEMVHHETFGSPGASAAGDA